MNSVRPSEHGGIMVTTAATDVDTAAGALADNSEQDELGEKEMFSQLVKPRVRYDVEVVTKLVVYTGAFFLCSPT